MVETNVKVPQFCGVCGTRLNETRSTVVKGYDIYTGMPNSVESGVLSCPNPTISDAGWGRVTRTNHRSYHIDANGVWV